MTPNTTCLLHSRRGRTVYGRARHATAIKTPCAIVRVGETAGGTSGTRSATRGAASETERLLEALFLSSTDVDLGDVIEHSGVKYRVVRITPQYDVCGQLDHKEVEAHTWQARD